MSNQTPPTGPELFNSSQAHVSDARKSPPGPDKETSFLSFAQVEATNANTAALVMFAGIYADAHGIRSRELEVWDEAVPGPPLVQCWGKEARRPQCDPVHTDDCSYADPVPEPKHELLPVGTRVLVSDLVYNERTRVPERTNPQPGKIIGYDMNKSKYRWHLEFNPGLYSTVNSWAFADNRVQIHPDGPVCPPAPEPVKREPTGPRIYVQNQRGKQGHVTEVATRDGVLRFRVQWYVPGVRPVWVEMATLRIIPEEEVSRCENGQTGDECGSGENQCEPCLQDEDEDEEGDRIEESMGLR